VQERGNDFDAKEVRVCMLAAPLIAIAAITIIYLVV
jgi:hypothetical protein